MKPSKEKHEEEDNSDDSELINWTPELTEAYNKSIQAIKDHILSTYPDYNTPFEMQTDASDYAVGAVLLQAHGVLGLFSEKLTEKERKYTMEEKKLLAILKGIGHFRSIVKMGLPLTVKSDQKSITGESHEFTESRMYHLRESLMSEYIFEVDYIKPEDNAAAHYLAYDAKRP